MGARPIEGRRIAGAIDAAVQEELAQLHERGITPSLVTVQVGDDAASEVYLERQRGAFDRRGIAFRILHLESTVTEAALLDTIATLNGDPATTGIMLQMPLPDGINPRAARRAIAPEKDVEGVHPENLGYLLSDHPALVPCTAAAVLEAVLHTGVPVAGAEAVVVGHSETVGKPVALLLAERLATVTVCHHATRDLAEHTRRAEILIVAVGKAGLITGPMIKEGAVVIDVGINRVPGARKGRLVGDVEAEGADATAGWRTPVPGGIGPITVAMLVRNTVRAAAGRTSLG